MNLRGYFCVLLYFIGSAIVLALPLNRQRSIRYIPSANGFCYIAYNLTDNKVDVFQPHIVDVWDVGRRTPDLIESVEFNLLLQNKRASLAVLPVESVSYEGGSGIIRVDQKLKEHSVTQYFWAPMTLDFKILLMVCHIENAAFLRLDPGQVQVHLNTKRADFSVLRMSQIDEQDLWVGAAVIYRPGMTETSFARFRDELFEAKPKNLLQAEKRWWQHWHRFENLPANVYGRYYDAVKQSSVFLKMAQCREPGPSHGQIVSHLSPDYPKVTIVSDMAYAVVALARLGHLKESKAALAFLLNSKAGQFECSEIKGQTWGLCSDYLISLYYYTGLGHERSIWKNDAPIIRLDGGGLTLWAIYEYVSKSADRQFFYKNEKKIENGILLPLIDAIDETGLIQNDSGWWNVAAPGEHFTLSSASAYNGLNCSALLSRESGAQALSTELIKISSQLRNTMLSKLVVGDARVIARSLEKKEWPHFLDGSAVEVINWQVVDPHWKTALSTLNAMDTFLGLAQPSKGYSRAYVKDKTERRENVFVDLRTIEALNRVNRNDRADALLAWVIQQISANTYMVPNAFQPATFHYDGVYPVVGRGAGACILALFSHANP